MKKIFIFILMFFFCSSLGFSLEKGRSLRSENTKKTDTKIKLPFKKLELRGEVLNATVNQKASVTLQISFNKNGELNAVGSYDNVNLFGRFDVAGVVLPQCTADSVCMRFSGDLMLGEDGSGFPKGTTGSYVMDIAWNSNEISGVYHIFNLPGIPYDQYGVLKLQEISRK